MRDRKIVLAVLALCIGTALTLGCIEIEEEKDVEISAEKIWNDTVSAVNDVKTYKSTSTIKETLPNETVESIVQAEINFDEKAMHMVVEEGGAIQEQWFINNTTYVRSDSQLMTLPIIWEGEDQLMQILGIDDYTKIAFKSFISEEIDGKECWLLDVDKTKKLPHNETIFEESKVWIAKDDYLPVKWEIHAIRHPDSTTRYETTILYDYNKPVSIQEP